MFARASSRMTSTASDAVAAHGAMMGDVKVLTRIADVRQVVAAARAQGKRIGFVPTMGALHEGHLRLVDAARSNADFVVLSIFVNPLQFGPNEDLAKYPRDVAGDIVRARARGADVIFAPDVGEMYSEKGTRTRVAPIGLDERWEGAARPGHFGGVLTVVAKLFNIVLPDIAVFGQKDAQQAAIVRAMVRDLDFPLEITVVPTVREADGLALSSRNVYLSADDRRRAVALSRALSTMQTAFSRGERDASALEKAGLQILARDAIEPDYLAVVDPETLEPVATASAGCVVLLAARVGPTRLIDNISLTAS